MKLYIAAFSLPKIHFDICMVHTLFMALHHGPKTLHSKLLTKKLKQTNKPWKTKTKQTTKQKKNVEDWNSIAWI